LLIACGVLVFELSMAFAAHPCRADDRFDAQGLYKRDTVTLGEYLEACLHG